MVHRVVQLRAYSGRISFVKDRLPKVLDTSPALCWGHGRLGMTSATTSPSFRIRLVAQYPGDHPRRVDNPSFVCRIVACTEKMYGHIWLVANNPTIMARCYVKDVAAFHFDHASIVHGCSGSS